MRCPVSSAFREGARLAARGAGQPHHRPPAFAHVGVDELALAALTAATLTLDLGLGDATVAEAPIEDEVDVGLADQCVAQLFVEIHAPGRDDEDETASWCPERFVHGEMSAAAGGDELQHPEDLGTSRTISRSPAWPQRRMPSRSTMNVDR